MDKIKNPFSPGAGTPPPELAGRDAILEQARVLFGRVRAKRPEKSILMTGLRGVGKTVLLNEMEYMAENDGYKTILIEAHEEKPLALLLIPHLRRLLFSLDRMKGAGDKVRRGIAVLKSFISGLRVTMGDVEFGLDIDPEQGSADNGDLEIDLPNLFVAVGEAARERGSCVAILIDEIQYLGKIELSALIMAMHKMQQRQLPIVLVGAGLPILPGLAGDSKSYAERLFNFPDLGPLPEKESAKAIREPIESAGEFIEPDALVEISRLTQGYPYFLQEWGYQAWDHAESSPITKKIIDETSQIVEKRLDENFFRVRFNRLTPKEKTYLRAMAHLGEGPYKTADVASALDTDIRNLGPVRAILIKKGMIYSPSHGQMAFTVPLFDKFMRRAIPEFPEKDHS
ncbi:ATP-binding protein [Maridesulfovibrio ferrireducens]|uniref:ATP-binding protein n=1 Tax=Maridesulfovibrio ferrireducens TaxID=246191 RepID=UPI001A34D034|nr:ATP-binding protein [Maridesulfovibrio ferrireducens]MBI9109972.1 ATP-binding protein [Maridesulfovibrio ferrireducens]